MSASGQRLSSGRRCGGPAQAANSARDNLIVQDLGVAEGRPASGRDDAGAEEEDILAAYEYFFLAGSHRHKCARRAPLDKPCLAIRNGEGRVVP